MRSGGRDAGRIAVFYAILGPAFIALLGLVVDGGGKVRALQEAHNIASEAARTAGQAIYAPGAILGEETVLDPDAAVAAAEAYLSATPATGHSVALSDDLQQLTITVEVSYDPIVLGFLDGGTWVVSGTVEATLVIG
jgi:Flp pilus assembly protein TadG